MRISYLDLNEFLDGILQPHFSLQALALQNACCLTSKLSWRHGPRMTLLMLWMHCFRQWHVNVGDAQNLTLERASKAAKANVTARADPSDTAERPHSRK